MKRIIAAITFFTRIPLWRMVNVSKQDYEHVVPLWPLMGWLTGGVMALVFWLSQMVFPVSVSMKTDLLTSGMDLVEVLIGSVHLQL